MAEAYNFLYYGDNLDVLRLHVAPQSVDLIYLDPPFNSKADYNVLFAEQDGTQAAAQIRAFEDTWHWDTESVRAYERIVREGGKVSQAMQGFRQMIGGNDVLAYLTMMAPRLIQLHRVLKPTGSIYLHCDPTASHYLKALMDAIFGPTQFRNELIWKRTTAHSSSKKFAPIHDTILYYVKTARATWNVPRAEYDQAYLDKYYRFDDGDGRLYWRADLTAAGIRHGKSGRVWHGIDPASIGRHWVFSVDTLDKLETEGRIYWPPGGKMPQYKRYREELKGKAVPDIWDDIDRINPVGSERLGYPTQKPEALLHRIINASSIINDVVLDPFCGCGTAIAAAHRLGRRWIGIDITHLAITLIKHRLQDAFGRRAAKSYKVLGEPVELPDAERLARENHYQFQWWALGLVGARPVEQKKGADRGIDGRLYFHDEPEGGKTKEVIISVKSGNVGVNQIRDLRAVVERERAAFGVFITMQEPTKPMRAEAAEAGFYKSPWGKGKKREYPRLQILTIEELLNGHGIDMPPVSETSTTFRKAPRAKRPKSAGGQMTLDFPET